MSRRNAKRKNGSSSGRNENSPRGPFLVIGEQVAIATWVGAYHSHEGSFLKEGDPFGFTGGVNLVGSLLHKMQDLADVVQLPVLRQEPLRMYRDKHRGQFCSSVHPPAMFSPDDVAQAVENACQVDVPPEAVVLVDTGSHAMTPDSMRVLRMYMDVWKCPIFLLSLGEASYISTMFEYAAIVRQGYCRHDKLCTCMWNYMAIHDLDVGGFCNSNNFSACAGKSKAPNLGLGEMATAYIVSEYARDASLRQNLGKSLNFLKHAFTSAPADKLVLKFGRRLVREFEDPEKKR